MQLEKYSALSLRIGLSLVLFYFAFNQLINAEAWAGLVPSYMSFMPSINVIYLNANVEIILGLLILVGLFTRVAAGLFALHLVTIIFALGINNPSAIRDVGLFFAALSLALHERVYLSVDSLIKKRRS
jgi:uncharacterized membrane protein YphA (DoxX/SURF4 family)